MKPAPHPAGGPRPTWHRLARLIASARQGDAGSLVAAVGVPLCAAGMAAAFRGPKQAHWRMLALTHGALGLVAGAVEPSARHRRVGRDDAVAAFRTGAGMVATGALLQAVAGRATPRFTADSENLRALASTSNPLRMCAYLLLVVAPGEELFWRGLVQGRLARRLGARKAAVATVALYGLAHVPTGNLGVTGAAVGLGSTLSLLRARGAGLERLALIHAMWVVPMLLAERVRTRTTPPPELGSKSPMAKDADMTTVPRDHRAGRRVTRWGRIAQLANNAVHVALYERSRGRLGGRMLGNQVGILTTTRPSDGEAYSVPLFVVPDGPDILLVASYRGSADNPRWYRNLLADPDAVLRIGRRVREVRARVLEAEERAAAWQRLVGHFEGYAEYQRRTTRELPVVRLSPRPGRG
ncbi:MAG TPA: nitroreductase/quinone reductase family protein [Pseudonocardiaceae bacterium]|jgi:deazaflavin-dependent oxidoreductase (nitroreductase family)|nr:nitroreductase/quinone reductase family protein [Pseudonocardiaceae bacterium]